MGLTDIPAMQLVEEIHAQVSPHAPPIVVYSPQPVSLETELAVRNLGREGVVRFADSPQRLLEETILLLHRADADLSESQHETLEEARRNDGTLKVKTFCGGG